MPSLDHENQLRAAGHLRVCGIDEAGRGPLAGPVCVAGVILPEGFAHPVLNDSKQLRENQREQLHTELMADARLRWHCEIVSAAEIDEINILQATYMAMRRAVAALGQAPAAALIDGNSAPPDLPCPVETIIDGDAYVASISAASIIAKVERDRMMAALCAQYPGYAFAKHKGYGTPEHQKALAELGPCAIHRRSFKPVRLAAGLAA